VPFHAADRLAFCLPITVNLEHHDFAIPLYACLHVATFVMLVAVMPLALLAPIGIALVCSIRFYGINQSRLSRSAALLCDPSGNWTLKSADAERSVLFEGLAVIGPVCLIRLRCVGSAVYWLTLRQHQSCRDWSRLRVLARLL